MLLKLLSSLETFHYFRYKGKIVDEDDPKKDEEEKLNLLMATLQEIGRKTTLMEEMEQDARSMLMRADDLQKQIVKFEKSKKLREEAERNVEKKVLPPAIQEKVTMVDGRSELLADNSRKGYYSHTRFFF